MRAFDGYQHLKYMPPMPCHAMPRMCACGEWEGTHSHVHTPHSSPHPDKHDLPSRQTPEALTAADGGRSARTSLVTADAADVSDGDASRGSTSRRTARSRRGPSGNSLYLHVEWT